MAKVKSKSEKQVTSIKKSFWTSDRNIAWILGALAFILYAQTIGFGYALDDVAVISNNKFVQEGFGGFGKILSTFYWHGNPSFAMSNSGLFRPLSLLLFATEWEIFGDKPGIFHFIHVVLYALVSMQLYLFLSELLGKNAGRLALIATLLWIVLPIHTEVVANLKSADEILSLLFSLLGLRFLLKWSHNSKMPTLLLAGGFFFLSFLSKEAAILILPIGLLMLMMFRGSRVKSLIVPGVILFAIALVWLGWHQWVISNAASDRITYDYRHNALLSNPSVIDQLGTAIGLQARYWIKMLIGYPLSYNYSFNEIPVNGFADIWPWISLAGIAAAGFFAWKNFKSQPAISFGLIFYLVTIILTSNVFYKIGDIFAERFTFVSSIGFCIILAVVILRTTKSQFAMTSASIGIVVVFCIAYSARTFARSSDWKDENTLFIADAENAPNSARVHDNVGVIYLNSALGSKNEMDKKQLFDQAFQQFHLAYEIDNRDFQAAQALGQIMYHKADFNASVYWSRKSIAARRSLQKGTGQEIIDDPTTLMNLGDAFIRLDLRDSAIYYYNQAADVQPRADIFQRIGDNYLRVKDTTAAINSYIEAVKLDSAFIPGWDKIANLKGMQRDYAGSNNAFRKIAALDSLNPNPWKMLYTNYSLMGDSLQMEAAAAEYYKRGGK